jgi:hypothetical protein
MSDCLCDNLVIDSCPPYAAKKTFMEYIERECNNCSGEVPIATSAALIRSTLGIDECCQEVVAKRGNQVLFDIDGSWIETGVRHSSFTLGYASTNLVANVANIPTITAISFVHQEVTINVPPASTQWFAAEAGTYLFNYTFVVSPTGAIGATNVNLEVYHNGAATLPSSKVTVHWQTSIADNLFFSMQGVARLGPTVGVSYRYLSGTTFTSNTHAVYVDLFKVSN